MVKVRIYTYPRQAEDENGDPIGKAPRRRQQTYSKLTPVQAAKLLVAHGLSWNGYSEAFDNESSTECWNDRQPFQFAELGLC